MFILIRFIEINLHSYIIYITFTYFCIYLNFTSQPSPRQNIFICLAGENSFKFHNDSVNFECYLVSSVSFVFVCC